MGYLYQKRNFNLNISSIIDYESDTCEYNVEAYTIINADYKKVFELLSNYKQIYHYDSFVRNNEDVFELADVLFNYLG